MRRKLRLYLTLMVYQKQTEVRVPKRFVLLLKLISRPQLTTLPNPEYMASQKELAWSMREILLDWLVQVHAV